MKKYYEEPELEEISILTTDVIMTSPGGEQQKTTETENTVQGNTEAGTDKQAAENSTVTSQENVETEELEIGGEDSWEDSADGWD